MMSPEEWRDFLKWEYQTAGRANLLWFSSANALARGADSAYAGYTHCTEIWDSSYTRDNPNGPPISTGRILTPGELDSLQDGGQGGVALMLLGYAIENMCKCILIERDPSLVDGEFGLARSLRTHDLVGLTKRCGCDLDQEALRALDLLTEFSIWAGKYPIPLFAVPRDSRQPSPGYWVRQRMGPVRAIWEAARPVLSDLSSIAVDQP